MSLTLTKADYEIPIILGPGGAVPTIPALMKVGQTVHYASRGGAVRIVFPDHSPYLKADGTELKEVTGVQGDGSEILTLRVEGKFDSRCYIKPAGKPEVGWSPSYPAAGGVHNVGH